MRSTSRILITGGVILAVAAIGILLGWLLTPRPAPPMAPPPMPRVASDSGKTTGTGNPELALGKKAISPTDPMDATPPTTSNQGVLTNWDDMVDEILRDNSDLAEKARKMLALFPRMPEAGQAETAKHIANLIDNKDYPEFSRYLTNTATPSEVQDVIMMDVLNRPNSVKMPILLDVAETPNHPKAADALQTLQLFLDEDYGTNWAVWQEKTTAWVKDNPD